MLHERARVRRNRSYEETGAQAEESYEGWMRGCVERVNSKSSRGGRATEPRELKNARVRSTNVLC